MGLLPVNLCSLLQHALHPKLNLRMEQARSYPSIRAWSRHRCIEAQHGQLVTGRSVTRRRWSPSATTVLCRIHGRWAGQSVDLQELPVLPVSCRARRLEVGVGDTTEATPDLMLECCCREHRTAVGSIHNMERRMPRHFLTPHGAR